jgi:hypothetical protein
LIPVGGKKSSLVHAHATLYSMDNDSFSGNKAGRDEDDPLLPSTAYIKNEWRYTSTLPYVFLA